MLCDVCQDLHWYANVLYVRHMRTHSCTPNASFKCVYPGCHRTSQKFRRFKSHSYSHCRWFKCHVGLCNIRRNLWSSVFGDTESSLRRCKPSPSTSPWPDVHLPHFVTIRLRQSVNTSVSMLYNTHNRRRTINENESVEATAWPRSNEVVEVYFGLYTVSYVQVMWTNDNDKHRSHLH